MKTTRIGLTVSNWFGVALILFGILQTESAAAADYWPTDAWRHSTPEAQGMRSQPLADMLAEIKKKSYRIDSITVIRNGYVVLLKAGGETCCAQKLILLRWKNPNYVSGLWLRKRGLISR